ncbi:hypothetical protein J4206_03270 [Candidatus Woesearchaeota archaeon]|nr:hypothetical protein [Candidatus Woesearchaeota archaeon]
MGIEEKVYDVTDGWFDKTANFCKRNAYQYSIDVLSGWMYYTPMYAAQEAVAKYVSHGCVTSEDVDTIVKTRLIGLAVHTISIGPMGIVRNHFAKKWGITKESPLVDKIKVNVTAITPIQAFVYAGMLVGGMYWSGHWDAKSSLYAWSAGVGLGIPHTFLYGPFQDKVRTLFGVKPAIGKK